MCTESKAFEDMVAGLCAVQMVTARIIESLGDTIPLDLMVKGCAVSAFIIGRAYGRQEATNDMANRMFEEQK